MNILVRHAAAGAPWPEDDRLRPLNGEGRRQAAALASTLRGEDVRRLVSSPFLRCVQTLEPLGAALGLEVEVDDRLAEGAGRAAEALLAEGGVVACTHGDVIHDLAGVGLKTGEFVRI